jgi:hypothetical protein
MVVTNRADASSRRATGENRGTVHKKLCALLIRAQHQHLFCRHMLGRCQPRDAKHDERSGHTPRWVCTAANAQQQ